MLISNFNKVVSEGKPAFIRAYNPFGNVESNYKLDADEFFLYCLLFTMQMKDDSIRTNVDIVNQMMPNQYKWFSEDAKNKKKIKESISSLISKQIFVLHNKLNKINNSVMLELTINNEVLRNDGVSDDKKLEEADQGYQNFSNAITYSKFLQFESRQELYIFYVVSRWSNGFHASFGEWANILDKKERQAINIIDSLVEKGIIYKNIGKNIEQRKQERNNYKITPFSQKEKTVPTIKKEQTEQVKVEKELENVVEVVNENEEQRSHTWHVKGSRLDVGDFIVYLTTKDEKLKKVAERRMEALSKSKNGKSLVENNLKDAQERIHAKEMADKELERHIQRMTERQNQLELNPPAQFKKTEKSKFQKMMWEKIEDNHNKKKEEEYNIIDDMNDLLITDKDIKPKKKKDERDIRDLLDYEMSPQEKAEEIFG